MAFDNEIRVLFSVNLASEELKIFYYFLTKTLPVMVSFGQIGSHDLPHIYMCGIFR
jgi:hypothetical protein